MVAKIAQKQNGIVTAEQMAEREQQLVNDAEAYAASLKVVDLRTVAKEYGIKSAKQYKRVVLEVMVASKVAETWIANYHDELQQRKANKQSKQNKSKSNTTKRYKAEKVAGEDVAIAANTIVSAKPDAEFLYQQNRKVLIDVMKMLHCEKWYRTYDKDTMVAKITSAFAVA